MPRWLRLFTFNKINEFYQSENEKIQSQTKQGTTNVMDPSGKINTKAIPPQPKKSGVKYK